MSQTKQIFSLSMVSKAFQERRYQVLEDSDIQGTIYKIKYKCLKHPDYVQSISWSNFKNGRGCRLCANERIGDKLSTSIQKIEKSFKEKDFQIVNYPSVVTYTTKIQVKCNKHPAIIQNLSLRNLNTGGCSFCNGKRIYAPDLKKDIEDKGFEWVDYSENIKSNSKIKIKCHVHGTISQVTISQIKRNQKINLCPDCQKEQNSRGNGKYTLKEVEKLFEDAGYILLSNQYINDRQKLEYLCLKHGIQKISLDKFLRGQRCPQCKVSHGEQKILNFLKKENIDFNFQKTFKNCKDKELLPFDFYLPQYNVCIEYQGIQHYEAIPFKQKRTEENYKKAEEKLKSQQKRDQIKRDFCKKNKIVLLEIKYSDFNNIESILEEFLKRIEK